MNSVTNPFLQKTLEVVTIYRFKIPRVLKMCHSELRTIRVRTAVDYEVRVTEVHT